MAALTKKPFQVYLHQDQLQALRTLAEQRGISMAGLVRQGVDKLLAEVLGGGDSALGSIALFDSGLGDLAEKHDEYI
ncbi:MAG: CopG family transcriptional regulator [Chloroflexota bacterium]